MKTPFEVAKARLDKLSERPKVQAIWNSLYAFLSGDHSMQGIQPAKQASTDVRTPEEVKKVKKKIVVYDSDGRVSARKRTYDPCRELNWSRRDMWEQGKKVSTKVENLNLEDDPNAQKKTRITKIMDTIER